MYTCRLPVRRESESNSASRSCIVILKTIPPLRPSCEEWTDLHYGQDQMAFALSTPVTYIIEVARHTPPHPCPLNQQWPMIQSPALIQCRNTPDGPDLGGLQDRRPHIFGPMPRIMDPGGETTVPRKKQAEVGWSTIIEKGDLEK